MPQALGSTTDAPPIGADLPDWLRPVGRELLALPYAAEIMVFGSAANGRKAPTDLDVFVDMRGRGEVDLTAFGGMLAIARRHYGYLDPFIRTDGGLIVRNDAATGWQRARNARQIELAIDRDGRPLVHVLAADAAPVPSPAVAGAKPRP